MELNVADNVLCDRSCNCYESISRAS